VAKTWIEGQSHLAFSTEKEYRAMLNRYWLPELGDVEIKRITTSLLLEVIAKQTWSPKTRNNALGPLKNVFDLAHMDGIIDSNPAAKIRNAKVQKPEPDPLTLEESELVLEWMNREPQWKHYFEVAFFTGMRTSELIALRWSDVDFNSRIIRVHRARVRLRDKGTKTSTIRDIELSSRAVDALKRQKEFTFLRDAEVFIHPHTGEPIIDDRPPRLFWESALKACGLRHRAAYQTRHTCISLWLMAGANPMWVARQAGHSSPQMTFNRYARWIARADAGLEMAKVEAKLDAGSIPKTGIKQGA
jgi:integrase